MDEWRWIILCVSGVMIICSYLSMILTELKAIKSVLEGR
jgi:hypothetical protein